MILANNRSILYSIKWFSTVKTVGINDVSGLPSGSTVFSMIQPSGKFHLGNYLGAISSWKALNDAKDNGGTLLFGTADLHAITTPKPSASTFRQMRKEAIASILSIGIDPKKAIVFHQSQVPQHTELHWYLSTITSMGYLNRMTQWKSKANVNANNRSEVGNVKLGLYSYPVLQAADILLYKATHVPVGEDQSQHLELTRELAEAFNKLYKAHYFPLPVTMMTPTKKVLNLLNPDKKMSKSDINQNSVIYINDEPDVIQRKIRKAVTDSISSEFKYDPVNRPGVSNLINIVSGIQKKSIADVESDISSFTSHKDLKDYVTEIIVEEFRGPRREFSRYINDPMYLEEVEASGAKRAIEIADKNLQSIKKYMGF
ncbi:HBR260Cp [Eremothecium sinecaudum]|uniref:Tryptophan--tRNA ligase, mitochondrial n=1 Tax=Eremothecium sinecaudum TaxID=45286 RepID=A0A125RE17_9SACH|nr:HBR260Cp [Eremothecium sinecaudum]AMD19161.1 HBR260Cp [Eremothecium sinecaudum]